MEIPGGEVAVLPELIRGHPSPHGFDLTAACFGTVALDALITGAACEPGDALIGLPSSGLHSNGYSLARAALGELGARRAPPELGGAIVADVLLEPTAIYVRAVLELLRSELDVRGLAHITGGGLLNLLRLHADVGFEIDAPAAGPAGLRPRAGARRGVARRGDVGGLQHGLRLLRRRARGRAEAAVALLEATTRARAQIGTVTADADRVSVPSLGLTFGYSRPRPRAALARGLGVALDASLVPAPGTDGSRFLASQSSPRRGSRRRACPAASPCRRARTRAPPHAPHGLPRARLPGRGVFRLTALFELLLQIACPFGAALMLLGLRLVRRGVGAGVLLALALDLLQPQPSVSGSGTVASLSRAAQQPELVDHRAAEDDDREL